MRPLSFLLMVIFVSSIRTEIVVQNISQSILQITVTGENSNYHQAMYFYDDSTTWFDARVRCPARGHGKLEDRPADWFRWRSLAQTLRENGVPVNVTFWTGIYRPFSKSSSWYNLYSNYGSQCIDVTAFVGLDEDGDQKRCISGRFEDMRRDPVFMADVCTNSHPYVCHTFFGNATIHLYSGFVMEELPANVMLKDMLNVTSDMECASKCELTINAFGFTYNFTRASCALYTFNDYSNKLTHSIVRTSDYVTHGVKQALSATYSSNVSTSAPLTSESFNMPECPIVNKIPSDYCACETQSGITPEQLKTRVDGLVTNLTIDPSTTRKNKRKYTSSKDDRTVSMVTGTLAACFITFVLALPVIADVVQNRKTMKKKKKTPNQAFCSTTTANTAT